jgi:hypothetical protein
MKRRQFIGVMGAITCSSIAGCSGDGGGDDGNGGDGGNQDEELISDTVEVNEDEYRYWELTIDSGGSVNHDLIVRNGPNIDFIVFEPSEFEHYEDGDTARYLSDQSKMDMTNYQGSAQYPEGEYRVVIDNTSWGEAVPPSNLNDDIAEVEISLTI